MSRVVYGLTRFVTSVALLISSTAVFARDNSVAPADLEKVTKDLSAVGISVDWTFEDSEEHLRMAYLLAKHLHVFVVQRSAQPTEAFLGLAFEVVPGGPMKEPRFVVKHTDLSHTPDKKTFVYQIISSLGWLGFAKADEVGCFLRERGLLRFEGNCK